MTRPTTTLPTRELQIEFLFLDLDTCTRCRATDATLREAIERTRPALDAAGVAVSETKTRVSNEALARTLGFVSSPTIRINGVDIAGDLVESACDTCSEGCACQGGASLAEDPFADDPQAAQRELAGCLCSLVDQLAEPYRSAVTAADLDGQTQTEVAQATGLSVSGMKSRVQRGRRQLRHLLTECCRVQTSPTGSISGYEPSTSCEEPPQGGGTMPRRCRCARTPP